MTINVCVVRRAGIGRQVIDKCSCLNKMVFSNDLLHFCFTVIIIILNCEFNFNSDFILFQPIISLFFGILLLFLYFHTYKICFSILN